MRGLLAGLAMTLASVSKAQADWISGSGQDPMTDQKWFGTSAPFGKYAVTFKCWNAGATQIGILIGPYESGLPFKDVVSAKMRVDKLVPVDLDLQPTDMSGLLVLQTSSEISDVIVPLLKQIGTAKDRVVLALGSVVLETSPKGAAKSVQAMVSGCALPNTAP